MQRRRLHLTSAGACGGRTLHQQLSRPPRPLPMQSNCAASVIGAETSGRLLRHRDDRQERSRSIQVGGPFVCRGPATVGLEVALTQKQRVERGRRPAAPNSAPVRSAAGRRSRLLTSPRRRPNPAFLPPLGATRTPAASRASTRCRRRLQPRLVPVVPRGGSPGAGRCGAARRLTDAGGGKVVAIAWKLRRRNRRRARYNELQLRRAKRW